MNEPAASLKKNLFLATTLFIFLLHTSCSRLLMQADESNTPTNCFNLMWETVDKHYAFFDLKKIDWQKAKQRYAARIDDKISQDSLYKVLEAMLNELHDGHVNLTTPTQRSHNWRWKQDFPDNYNFNFVAKKYLGTDFQITGPFFHQWLSDSIGYVHYGSFSAPTSDSDLNYILSRFSSARGLVFDVRDNGGGAMNNVLKIINRFTQKKIPVGYSFMKNGTAHNQFTKGTTFYALPTPKAASFLKPVMLLINRGCYSATTFFAGFMSALPNVTLIGDQTGGGGGIPISSDLPNGWQYRFSATYTLLSDSTNIESGVTPKIKVTTNAKDEIEGKDKLIEKAMEIIKKTDSGR